MDLTESLQLNLWLVITPYIPSKTNGWNPKIGKLSLTKTWFFRFQPLKEKEIQVSLKPMIRSELPIQSNETTFVYLKRFQPTSQVGRRTSSNKKMQRIPTIFVSPFEHYQPKQCINYGQVTLESTMHRYCIVWFSNTWICILGCLEKVKHIPPNGGLMVISLMFFIPILPIPFNICNNSVGDSCWKGGRSNVLFDCPQFESHLSHKKNPLTFHYTARLIRTLIIIGSLF